MSEVKSTAPAKSVTAKPAVVRKPRKTTTVAAKAAAPAKTAFKPKAAIAGFAKALPLLAEKVDVKAGVKKARAAITTAQTYSKDNVAAVVASAAAANKGAAALRAQSLNFPMLALTESLAAAKSLSAAKSMHDVVGVYGAFAKTALDMHLSEMGKMSATVSTSFKDAAAPLKARLAQTWPMRAAT